MIIYQPGTFGNPLPEAEPVPETPAPETADLVLPLPLPAPEVPWWVGKKLTCGSYTCSCVFGVEEGDTHTTDCLPYVFAARPEGRPAQIRLSALCPVCHLLNRYCESDVEEPDIFGPVDDGEDCLL